MAPAPPLSTGKRRAQGSHHNRSKAVNTRPRHFVSRPGNSASKKLVDEHESEDEGTTSSEREISEEHQVAKDQSRNQADSDGAALRSRERVTATPSPAGANEDEPSAHLDYPSVVTSIERDDDAPLDPEDLAAASATSRLDAGDEDEATAEPAGLSRSSLSESDDELPAVLAGPDPDSADKHGTRSRPAGKGCILDDEHSLFYLSSEVQSGDRHYKLAPVAGRKRKFYEMYGEHAGDMGTGELIGPKCVVNESETTIYEREALRKAIREVVRERQRRFREACDEEFRNAIERKISKPKLPTYAVGYPRAHAPFRSFNTQTYSLRAPLRVVRPKPIVNSPRPSERKSFSREGNGSILPPPIIRPRPPPGFDERVDPDLPIPTCENIFLAYVPFAASYYGKSFEECLIDFTKAVGEEFRGVPYEMISRERQYEINWELHRRLFKMYIPGEMPQQLEIQRRLAAFGMAQRQQAAPPISSARVDMPEAPLKSPTAPPQFKISRTVDRELDMLDAPPATPAPLNGPNDGGEPQDKRPEGNTKPITDGCPNLGSGNADDVHGGDNGDTDNRNGDGEGDEGGSDDGSDVEIVTGS